MYTRIFYTLLSLILLTQANVFAHNYIETKKKTTISDSITTAKGQQGRIIINQDKRIDRLLKANIISNSRHKGYDGYRIQIYSESSIDYSIKQAELYKKEFENKFPELQVYLNYFDPNFKIRVGNFRDKIDCEASLRRIKKYYPNCYAVRTFITFKELQVTSKAQKERELLLKRDSLQLIDSLDINQTLNNNTNE